jgi:hypothetical protein
MVLGMLATLAKYERELIIKAGQREHRRKRSRTAPDSASHR